MWRFRRVRFWRFWRLGINKVFRLPENPITHTARKPTISNKLTATEKAQNIGILVGTWLAVFGLNTLARTPKPMSQIMQMVGMVVIFWTILAAVFSLVFFVKTLIGNRDHSWKTILLLTVLLWLWMAVYGNI